MVLGSYKHPLLPGYTLLTLLPLSSVNPGPCMYLIKTRLQESSQANLINNLLTRLQMQQCKTRCVALSQSIKVSKGVGEPLGTTRFPYSTLVASLLHLSVGNRSDITLAIGVLRRYMQKPSSMHWLAAKSVLRCLALTSDYCIVYQRSLTLLGYCDAAYPADVDARHSTTG